MTDTADYLLMAAGTGGHVFPALAVARKLRSNEGPSDKSNVSWLGTPTGMENRLLENEKIPLYRVDMKGFRGKAWSSKLLMPWRLLVSIFQSVKVIKRVNPKVVIGFGGYITLPGGIAAKLLGKKLIIHEQNSVAGSANRLLANIADQVLVAFPGTLKREQLVGNPVRDQIQMLHGQDKSTSKDRSKKVLILGGSLGAQALNTLIPQVFTQMPESLAPEVWHQTGKGKSQGVEQAYQAVSKNIRVEEFINDMAQAYAWADIIICRAGALTVSEIAVAGLPAIFVPYPYAIDDHQTGNADWLVKNQAAWVIPQPELTVERMVNLLTEILSDEKQLMRYSEKLKKLAMPNATQEVVMRCYQLNEGLKNAA